MRREEESRRVAGYLGPDSRGHGGMADHSLTRLLSKGKFKAGFPEHRSVR